VILLSVPLIFAQDLSKYRNFSLGTSLTELSKQVNGKPADARIMHQSPALIQELSWWPIQAYQSSAPPESVQEILFSFCNGELYRIVATYDSASTQGLTTADMVEAVSAKYGTATPPVAEPNSPTVVTYSSTGETIALWEDSQYSLTLWHFPLSRTFQLVMFSKQLNGQAEAAIAAAVTQEHEDAPRREIARLKKEAEDLEALRGANLKAFRP
jgi:hypothetical protein